MAWDPAQYLKFAGPRQCRRYLAPQRSRSDGTFAF
jgi:hypothetical protein